MSDTDSHAPRRKGCCGKLGLLLAVVLGSLAAYVGWAVTASRSDAPLAFEPIAYRPLEEGVLTLKFEVLEGVGGLLRDSIEVELDERELNLVLFGKAGHTSEQKARVLIQGDQLRFEGSRPRDGGGYLNLQVDLKPSLGPSTTTIEVLGGTLGRYKLDGVARGILRGWLEQQITKARAEDRRLGRLKAMWVKGGKVTFIYDKP